MELILFSNGPRMVKDVEEQKKGVKANVWQQGCKKIIGRKGGKNTVVW